jgi:dTMP kinase
MTDIVKRKGLFIVVEGMDGSGKTTCTDFIETELRTFGIDLLRTYEVGGTPIGKELRKLCFSRREDDLLDPLARMLMIYAARLQHLKNVIFPATQRGQTVLCDRFVQSTRVYQGIIDGQAEIMDRLDTVKGLESCAEAPDVLVYLKCDPIKAYERGVARKDVDNDTYKNDIDKAIRIGKAYDEVVHAHVKRQDCMVYIVDTNQPLEQMHQQLRSLTHSLVSYVKGASPIEV